MYRVQVGDMVELVKGYENYGDAARGPLSLGDRGQVKEIQLGPNGDRSVMPAKARMLGSELMRCV